MEEKKKSTEKGKVFGGLPGGTYGECACRLLYSHILPTYEKLHMLRFPSSNMTNTIIQRNSYITDDINIVINISTKYQLYMYYSRWISSTITGSPERNVIHIFI